MTIFEKINDTEPFLRVQFETKDDFIYAESDSMVAMSSNIDMSSELQGGFLQSIARRFLNEESIFLQKFQSNKANSSVILAPKLIGDIAILNLKNNGFYVNDGCFVACDGGIKIDTKFQNNILNSLFAGNGGFFVQHFKGVGSLAISGFGSLIDIDLDNEEIIVDNYHLVAWDDALHYEVVISKGKNLFSKIFTSFASGEFLMIKISGKGKIYINSRNFLSFIGEISPYLIKSNN